MIMIKAQAHRLLPGHLAGVIGLLNVTFACIYLGCQQGPVGTDGSITSSSQLLSASDPIGVFDPSAVSDTICLKNGTGPCFGFSAMGGGYGNLYKHSSIGANWAAAGFGRGWQSSIRDDAHRGMYNPTQAGFSDDCGKPTTLVRETSRLGGINKRIVITPFAAPLFRAGDNFDFTQSDFKCDDKYAEPSGGYPPAGMLDTDSVDNEGPYNQWSGEVKSEFDFSGFYEDVSAMVTNGAGVMRHVFHYDYRRVPKAISQFGETAIVTQGDDQGKPVLDVTKLEQDISPTEFSGNQTGRAVDLSHMTVSWGPRITDNSNFAWYYYGTSNHQTLSAGYPLPSGNTRYGFSLDQLPDPPDPCPGKDEYCTTWPLLILATSIPSSGHAVGVFYPDSSCNGEQFRGIHINADGSETVVYAENRIIQKRASIKHAGSSIADPDYGYWLGEWTMPLHFTYTGMFAPTRGELENKGATFERFSMEIYILTGTPNQIRDAAIQIGDHSDAMEVWGCN